MTPAERAESERRRKLIAAQNRAANPQRTNRLIPPGRLEEDLAALLGRNLRDESGPVNWAALTRDG